MTHEQKQQADFEVFHQLKAARSLVLLTEGSVNDGIVKLVDIEIDYGASVRKFTAEEYIAGAKLGLEKTIAHFKERIEAREKRKRRRGR